MDFDEDVHLILGSNGSGKSTIMYELSPQPANKNRYEVGGYKKISIEHRGSEYKLGTFFHDGETEYHFSKDGSGSKPGLKQTEYKRLVEQEFGLTQDVFDLMIGKLKFSQMTGTELRHWITRLSDVDYTYALGYYRRLQEKIRDLSGAIKQQQSRLGAEQSKLLGTDEEAVLRQKAASLRQTTEYLLAQRQRVTFDKTQVEHVRVTLEHQNTKAKRLLKEHASYGFMFGQEELAAEMVSAQATCMQFERFIETKHKEIEKAHTRLSEVVIDETPVEQLKAQLLSLQKSIADIQKQRAFTFDYSDPALSLQSVSMVSETFLSILNQLRPDPDKTITRQSYMDITTSHAKVQEDLLKYTAQYSSNALELKELEHCRAHNKVSCPSCSHQWSIGYDAGKHTRLSELSKHLQTKIDALTVQSKQLQESIQEQNEYLSLLSQLAQLFRSWPALEQFWQYCSSTNLLRTNPRSLVTEFVHLKSDITTVMELTTLGKECSKLSELIAMKELSAKNNSAALKEHFDSLVLDLEALQVKQRASQAYRQQLQSFSQVDSSLQSTVSSIEKLLSEWEGLSKQHAVDNLNHYLSDCIRELQLEENYLIQQVNKVDVQKALVADIQEQIGKMTADKDLLTVASKELSPVDGMIARGLTNFINHLIGQMNAFIESVWASELSITPFIPDESGSLELDYKFSIVVGECEQAFDLRDASLGQLEIINRAFVVVCMKYLGLEDFPLYLDEFGAQMDYVHRQRASSAMMGLLDNSNFSQMFIISHHENSYTSLVNADVTVLCPNNIILPGNKAFNQKTIIN